MGVFVWNDLIIEIRSEDREEKRGEVVKLGGMKEEEEEGRRGGKKKGKILKRGEEGYQIRNSDISITIGTIKSDCSGDLCGIWTVCLC